MRTTRSGWGRARSLTVLVTALVTLATACGGGADGKAEVAPPSTEAPPTTAGLTTGDEGTTTPDIPDDEEVEEVEEEPTTRTADDYDYRYQDSFDHSAWLTGCNEQGCAGIEDGHFFEDVLASRKEIDQHQDWPGADFYEVGLQIDIVRWGAGNPQGGVVCFSVPDAWTYYDLTVSAGGVASIYRFEDGAGEALTDGIQVAGWNPERPVTLLAGCTETADGVALSLAIDGEVVAQVTDADPLPAGEIGLITYGDTQALSTVWYDDLSVVGDLA